MAATSIKDQIPTDIYRCAFCEEIKEGAGIYYHQCLLAKNTDRTLAKSHELCLDCFAELEKTHPENKCPLCSKKITEIKTLQELKALLAARHQIEKRIVTNTTRVYEVYLPSALECFDGNEVYLKGVLKQLKQASEVLAEAKKIQEVLPKTVQDPAKIDSTLKSIEAIRDLLSKGQVAEAKKLLASLIIPSQSTESSQSSWLSYLGVTSLISSLAGLVISPKKP